MSNLLPRLEFLAQALVRRRRDCPHCRSEHAPVVARKSLVVRIRRCEDCLLYFTDPTYQSALGVLYDRVYSAEGLTTDTPDAARLAELRRTAFRGTDKDFHARLARLRHLAPGPRLLEVGSSWGYFLAQAEDEGFEATGLEISDRRREYGCRELGVRMVDSWAALADERFDVVYSAHTLEHFTDLQGILPGLVERLASGGVLAIEVPNFDLERQGAAVLPTIGAVHPLGFETGFFRRNLPSPDLRIRGFFDAWEDVPREPVEVCAGDVVIVIGEKAG